MLSEFIRGPIVLSRVQRGNRAHEQAKFLYNAHKAEIEPGRWTEFEERLEHADDLKHGLPVKDSDKIRKEHIKQSKMYCKHAEEMLDFIEHELPVLPLPEATLWQ